MVTGLPGSADAAARVASPRAALARRWALIGAVTNTIFAVVKIAAGVLGNSYALIADGVESGLDVAGSLVIWFGLRFAERQPDENHPFGHGKAEPVSAVVVAAGVLTAAVVLGAESVREIFLVAESRAAPSPATLLVLVVVVLVKEALFRRVVRLGEELGSSAARADAWHHRADAFTSAAAFVGITIALVGGPRWAGADAWAALVACVFIAFNGWRMLVPAVGEIMDIAPPPEIESRVRAAAAAVPGVVTPEKCRVRKMGLNFYVDLHVAVDGAITVDAGHNIAHRVKDAVRAADDRIADVLIHVEPA